MTFQERLKQGAPLRPVELARYIGYSRNHVAKWIKSGAISVVRMPIPGSRPLIPVTEAERIGKILKLI